LPAGEKPPKVMVHFRETYAERPIVGVNPDNRAMIMFRQFGRAADVHQTGDLATAVADLNAAKLEWATGFLTADGQTNWHVAFDIDDSTGNNMVVNVKRLPGDSQQESMEAARKLTDRGKRQKADRVSAHTFADGPVDAQAQAASAPTVAGYTVPYATDLAILAEDVQVSDAHPMVGDVITISATAGNNGLKATSAQRPFTVKFFEGTSLISEQRIESAIQFNQQVSTSVPYTVQRGGLHTITVVVDADNAVTESNEANNRTEIRFGQPPAPLQLSAGAETGKEAMSLAWAMPNANGIDYFQVLRSTTPGGPYEFVGDTSQMNFSDTLVQLGTVYYYVVVAVDIHGVRSASSNEATGRLGQ
jgi:hypothetical protein